MDFDTHGKVAEYAKYGLKAVNVNSDTPNTLGLWKVQSM